jgi:hypothetical protein
VTLRQGKLLAAVVIAAVVAAITALMVWKMWGRP